MEKIITNRLIITCLNTKEMNEKINNEKDSELKQAYKEMLDGSIKHPNEYEWYAIWNICLKDGRCIGDYCFKGLNNGVSEIGYGIIDEFQGNGYATEAITAALDWAFKHDDVKTIEAEVEKDNIKSKRVLEKCGFIENGQTGLEGPRYSIYKK